MAFLPPKTSPFPHFKPNSLLSSLYCSLYISLFFSLSLSLPFNITTLLNPYPELSTFSHLLSVTGVAADLTHRSSLTLLAVPNPAIQIFLAGSKTTSQITDVIRYHVLLQYLDWSDLRQIPAAGKLITTLYQTTGRATDDDGAVNLTRNPVDGRVSVRCPAPFSPGNATILSLVKSIPYAVSVFTVNSLVLPYGFDLTASENLPPLGINITRVLTEAKNFNVVVSMLTASGVTAEFERDEQGAGITVFVPTDGAFVALPPEKLQSLPADKKAVILKYHVLHSYYPLGSLESIVNPVQPTLATEDSGAGSFTLNITRVNRSVAIDTGIVQASITQTVFDQNPVAIFAVSKVLLPREIFGNRNVVQAIPPDYSPAPEFSFSSPELEKPPTHFTSPPGSDRDLTGYSGVNRGSMISILLVCAGLFIGAVAI